MSKLVPNGIYDRRFKGNARVISFGIHRSGSTFVYQVLGDIYPAGVAKTHEYIDLPLPVVATVRDLRDCVVSAWRALDPRVHRMRPEDIENIWHGQIEIAYHALRRYQERNQVIVLRYEEFVKDPMSIWPPLESFLDLKLPDPAKDRIVKRHSPEENAKLAASHKDFSSWDPKNQIHGNHLAGGEPGVYMKFTNWEGRRKMTELMGDALKSLQYEI